MTMTLFVVAANVLKKSKRNIFAGIIIAVLIAVIAVSAVKKSKNKKMWEESEN